MPVDATNLRFDLALAARYTSAAQRIRVMSEAWAATHLYCPECGSRPLQRYPHNARAADLLCPKSSCGEQYELKSGKRIGRKVVNGDYVTLLQRLQSISNPNLILLSYQPDTHFVNTVQIVPRLLFTPAAIEPRKRLSAPARRAGWQGCNILLENISSTGLIKIIDNGVFIPEVNVRLQWASLSFLKKTGDIKERTWLLSTLRLIESFKQREFNLAEIYSREADFVNMFPSNKHIKAKLRQQLQRLRDAGQIEFLGMGRYRRISG